MTQVELRDLLIERVGWKQPTNSTYTLDATSQISESGRYFQDEYPSVTIKNIMATANDLEEPTDEECNAYLQDLTKRACLLVVSDVFRVMDIMDDVLTNRVSIFDDCITKRMAIIVGEIILNSTRSNHTERITKEQMQQLFFELNGNADSASSRANPNFPTYIGLKSRYGMAVSELKDLLGQEKALDVFTHRIPNWRDDENIIL